MGLKFKDIVIKKEISISELNGKVLAVDSLNMLYQFLTTIRAPDGSALTDSKGRVTSHLIGLFSRVTSLMEQGLKLVFVFDGKAPEIKQKTWEKRGEVKKEAALKLQEAITDEEKRKFASRTAILTREMLDDAQKVITALGLPIVQAPSEGEAQTAYMVKKGTAYASISQDYDNLIFGCPRLIRNLSLEGKRKRAGKFAYEKIKPEMILLSEVLEHLQLDREQLIVLALLVGTDYNPGGIHGIGPQKGLKLLKEFNHDFIGLFQKVEWEKHSPDVSWHKIFDTIKDIPVTDDYKLEWKQVQGEELFALLVNEHNFSAERVQSKIDILAKESKQQAQKGLRSYF